MAYTRATAMESSLRINTDHEPIWTNHSLLTLQRARLHGVLVRLPALLRLREQFDEVVDTEDGDGGLCGKLEALCFDHSGLVHASLTVVSGLAVHQVQTNPTRQSRKHLNTACSTTTNKLTKHLRQSET